MLTPKGSTSQLFGVPAVLGRRGSTQAVSLDEIELVSREIPGCGPYSHWLHISRTTSSADLIPTGAVLSYLGVSLDELVVLSYACVSFGGS